MTSSVSFDVAGIPAPQGSKKAFVVAGKARMTDMGGEKHRTWRNAVTAAAAEALRSHGAVLDGPLALTITFRFPRPASARKGATWKPTAPDLDKLLRAAGDSLTASGLIHDDARIARINAEKRLVNDGEGPGAHISITPL